MKLPSGRRRQFAMELDQTTTPVSSNRARMEEKVDVMQKHRKITRNNEEYGIPLLHQHYLKMIVKEPQRTIIEEVLPDDMEDDQESAPKPQNNSIECPRHNSTAFSKPSHRRSRQQPQPQQIQKDQFRIRASLNGHVLFSHHPKQAGELFHVEWWYYLSTFDHTMVPFFKHSNGKGSSIVQIGSAIHCRDYQLRFVLDNTTSATGYSSDDIAKIDDCTCHGDLSHFWSKYYMDKQQCRMMTANETIYSDSTDFHNQLYQQYEKYENGHDNSMIEDDSNSTSTIIDNRSDTSTAVNGFTLDDCDDDVNNCVSQSVVGYLINCPTHKHSIEEPQLYDQSNEDEDYFADSSTTNSTTIRHGIIDNDEALVQRDGSAGTVCTHTQTRPSKCNDEDMYSYNNHIRDMREDESMPSYSLDQFIESSSYHINEQFKIISRELSRIFF